MLANAKNIAILGGGPSGLTAVYKTAKKYPNKNIYLIEKQDRVGGWICSKDEDHLLFEKGPRSLLTSGSGRKSLQLIEELELQDEVIIASKEYSSKRFLYVNGKVTVIPNSLIGLVTSSLTRKAIFPALKEPFVPTKHYHTNDTDESIHSFFERRFGSYIANTFIAPFILGIYGGNTKTLSAQACTPSKILVNYEREHGSAIRGMFKGSKSANSQVTAPESAWVQQTAKSGRIFSFKNGLETLTNGLAQQCRKLPNVHILTGHDIKKLSFNQQTSQFTIQFHTDSKNLPNSSPNQPQTTLSFDHVISALPSHSLASIIKQEQPGLASLLEQIKSVNMGVVNLGYKDVDLIPSGLRGFGYLIPPKEKQQVLGVTFDSCSFPQQNRTPNETRMTVMMGGDPSIHENALDIKNASVDQIIELSLKTVRDHLGITAKPSVISPQIYHRAIPQYHVGFLRDLSNIESKLQSIYGQRFSLLGNSFYGVGVSDCVAKATLLSQEL